LPLWSITIETARPSSDSPVPSPQRDDLARRFHLHLEDDEWVSDAFTLIEDDRICAQFTFECGDPTKAVTKSLDRFQDAAEEAKLPMWPVVVVQTLAEDSHLAPVVGSSEAAEMLSISRQRLAQLSKRPDFPRAWATIAATPVWLRTQVRRFERGWPRRNGRPRKVVSTTGASDQLD
jgi:hypothetical protein